MFRAIFMMRGSGAARTFLDRQNVDHKIKTVEGSNIAMAVCSSTLRGRDLFDRLPYRVALDGGWESEEAARSDIDAADLAARVFFDARKEAKARVLELALTFKQLCGNGSSRKTQESGMALASMLLGGTDLEKSAVQPSRNAALHNDTDEFQRALGLVGGSADDGDQQRKHNTIRVISKVNELCLIASDSADERQFKPEPPGALPAFFVGDVICGVSAVLRKAAMGGGAEYAGDDGAIFAPKSLAFGRRVEPTHALDGRLIFPNRSLWATQSEERVAFRGDAMACAMIADVDPLRRSENSHKVCACDGGGCLLVESLELSPHSHPGTRARLRSQERRVQHR